MIVDRSCHKSLLQIRTANPVQCVLREFQPLLALLSLQDVRGKALHESLFSLHSSACCVCVELWENFGYLLFFSRITYSGIYHLKNFTSVARDFLFSILGAAQTLLPLCEVKQPKP